MDITGFLSNITAQIIAGVGAILTGAIIYKARDYIICKAITLIDPQKYIDFVINKIDKEGNKLLVKLEALDVKYIDPLKKDNPEAGKMLENIIATSLTRLGTEIKNDCDNAANNILDR